ncbi:unnamed protein product, partial [Rotaria sp. Silwood2]
MRCRPDGKFNWILHVKDHFSKFSWAYPLECKQPESVAEKLLNQFYAFGPPCILQSGNEKEFVAQIIKHMRKTWTDLVIINGKYRHSETQRLIEYDNHTLEMALDKWMHCHHTNNWSKGLGPVVYAINTNNVAKITNKTPYEMVFKQDPSISDFGIQKVISQSGTEDEESLPENLIYKLNEIYDSDISDTGTSDSNGLENNNQLNASDANNQRLYLTPQSQSSTRTS